MYRTRKMLGVLLKKFCSECKAENGSTFDIAHNQHVVRLKPNEKYVISKKTISYSEDASLSSSASSS